VRNLLNHFEIAPNAPIGITLFLQLLNLNPYFSILINYSLVSWDSYINKSYQIIDDSDVRSPGINNLVSAFSFSRTENGECFHQTALCRSHSPIKAHHTTNCQYL